MILVRRITHRWKVNIKTNIKEINFEKSIVLRWLGISFDEGLL